MPTRGLRFRPCPGGTEQRSHGTEQRSHGTEQRSHGTEQRSHGTEQRSHGTEQRSHGTDEAAHGAPSDVKANCGWNAEPRGQAKPAVLWLLAALLTVLFSAYGASGAPDHDSVQSGLPFASRIAQSVPAESDEACPVDEGHDHLPRATEAKDAEPSEEDSASQGRSSAARQPDLNVAGPTRVPRETRVAASRALSLELLRADRPRGPPRHAARSVRAAS